MLSDLNPQSQLAVSFFKKVVTAPEGGQGASRIVVLSGPVTSGAVKGRAALRRTLGIKRLSSQTMASVSPDFTPRANPLTQKLATLPKSHVSEIRSTVSSATMDGSA